MLQTRHQNNSANKLGSLGTICLLLLFFFVPIQGALWLHPHGSHIFSSEAARCYRIKFFDRAAFCHCAERFIHLESASAAQEGDCSSCQIITQLGQNDCLILPPYPNAQQHEPAEYYSYFHLSLGTVSQTGRSPPSPFGPAI
ncbi:MAG: hypothetical protein ACI38Q_08900 [Candidatus Bruticola sp.]